MASRRWLKIGGGVAAGITTIVGLFYLLTVLYGFEIIDLTGDHFCEGTYESPCISEFEVKNPNSYNVDIYSKDQVKLEFSPEIKDWALFVPDGRCSATGKCACDLKNGERLGFEDWRCVDFTNKTKPRKDKVYNFRFERYSTTKFRLAGIKKNPGETIKWTFGVNDQELDPVWMGIDKNIVFTKLIENKADLTTGEAIFEVYNPFSKDISSSELSFDFIKARGNDIKDYKIYINYSESYQVPIYEKVTTLVDISDRKAEVNDTAQDLEETVVAETKSVFKGYKTEYRESFKAIDSIPPGHHKIKLVGEWRPTLGVQKIDWIPSMNLESSKYSELSKDITLTKDDWAWWNVTWKQRRPINITENQETGNLNNFQVNLSINFTNGMNTDFSDLRFTWVNQTDSEEYEISYWDQKVIDSNRSDVWIKAPIIYNATNTTVYMYWDNDAATSKGNYSDTMKFEEIWNWTKGDDTRTISGVLKMPDGRVIVGTSMFTGGYTDDTAVSNITYLNDSDGSFISNYQSVSVNADHAMDYIDVDSSGNIWASHIDTFSLMWVHKYSNTLSELCDYECAHSQCEYAQGILYYNDSSIFSGAYYGSGINYHHHMFMIDSSCNEGWYQMHTVSNGYGMQRQYAYDDKNERVLAVSLDNKNPDVGTIVGRNVSDGAESMDYQSDWSDDAGFGIVIIEDYIYAAFRYNYHDAGNENITIQKINKTSGVLVDSYNFTKTGISMNPESMLLAFDNTFFVAYSYGNDGYLAHFDENLNLLSDELLITDYKPIKKYFFDNEYIYIGNSNISTTTGKVFKIEVREHTDQYPTYSFGPIDAEDTTPPTYSNNMTSSTLANTAIVHSLKWTDLNNSAGPANLSSFTFSWHNGVNWTKTNSTSDLESGTQSFEGEGGGGGNTTLFFDGAEGWTLDTNCPANHPWTECSVASSYVQSLDSSSVSPNTIQSGSRVIGMWDIDSGDEATTYLKLNNDTSGFDEVWITFWTNTGLGNDGSSENCRVEASTTDSGYTYVFNSYDEGWYDSTWHYKEVNITDYQSSTTWLRFGGKPTFTRPNNEWCDWDNVTLKGVDYGGGGSSEDVNKTPVDYLDISSEIYYEVLDNITVIVNVDYYNTSGSVNNGNSNATLWLEVYNGSDWLDEGDFSVAGTGDFSVTVSTTSILSAWNTVPNRDLRISARLLDYNSSSLFDTINWSSVIVNITSEQEFLDDPSVDFNSTYCPSNITICWSNVTKTVTSTIGAIIKWKVRAVDSFNNYNQSKIFQYLTTEAGGDTCTYTSGNWNIDCSDNCVIDSNVNIDSGSNISMTGSGIFTIQNGIKIKGWTYRYADRTCYVKAFGSGGFFQ